MICNSAFESSLGQAMRTVFDAQPSPALIVDSDARIQAFNTAAGGLLPEALDPTTAEIKVIGTRFGDALGCIHADGQVRNCGRGPLCQTCVVRESLAEAMVGNSVVRKRMHLRFLIQGEVIEYYGLITSSPFEIGNSRYVLLIIEDIGVIAELLRVIPICSGCGKVRDEENRWVRLESYFKDKWDVDFSHCFCPACLEEQMKTIGLQEPSPQPR